MTASRVCAVEDAATENRGPVKRGKVTAEGQEVRRNDFCVSCLYDFCNLAETAVSLCDLAHTIECGCARNSARLAALRRWSGPGAPPFVFFLGVEFERRQSHAYSGGSSHFEVEPPCRRNTTWVCLSTLVEIPGGRNRCVDPVGDLSEADVEAISIIRCTGQCLNGGLADPDLLMEERPA